MGEENGEACTWAYGTFVVDADRVDLTFVDGGGIAPNGAVNKPGEFFAFRWSRYRDTSTFNAIQGEVSPEGMMIKPWRSTREMPSASLFPDRCPPPAEALNAS